MKYRTKAPKDTSKHSLLTRAEKRERVLAYCYTSGSFDIDENGEIIARISLSSRSPFCLKAMYSIISPVEWFIQVPNFGFEDYSFKNAPTKHYMRFLKTRAKRGVGNVRRRVLQYLFSPISLFVFLTESTGYIRTKRGICACVKIPRRDMDAFVEWFHEVYNIEVKKMVLTLEDISLLLVAPEDLQALLLRIKTDKYVGRYFKDLTAYIDTCQERMYLDV